MRIPLQEIYKIAIRIEEDGERFYSKLAEIVTDEDLKKFFNLAAKSETSHKKAFQELEKSWLIELQKNSPTLNEGIDYEPKQIPQSFFSKEHLNEGLLKLSDYESYLNFASELEEDSIEYYQKLLKFIAPSNREKIIEIINMEKKHLSSILNYKKNRK